MAELGFDGKVAIVTGAGGGLGREHALLLASRGALVVVNDVGGALDGSGSDVGPGQHVVEEIKGAGGEAMVDTNSVATPEGVQGIAFVALFPLTFVASTFVPIESMPSALRDVASWNPITTLADALREAFDPRRVNSGF